MIRPAGGPGRFDPFRALSREERARHIERYRAYLARRNGNVDPERRRLSRREAWFRELDKKPVEWLGDTNLEAFYEHYRDQGECEIDQRTVWLVATAKANLGESYGVDLELSRLFRDPRKAALADEIYLQVMLEEHYHARILKELCRTCGLDPEPRRPPPFQLGMIHLMMFLPEWARWIPILAGETLGSEVFKLLAEGAAFFEEQPEVQERVRSLLREIWIDEVFHVAYLRAKVGPWGARVARWILPLVSWAVMRDVPQLHRLGWTRKSVLERIRQGIEIPPGFGWMPPDPD